MLINYIFCIGHPFNQQVWILYNTNRERKREIARNGETPRGWKTEKKLYIYWSNERQADSTTSVFAVAEPRWKPSDTVQNHCENALLILQWSWKLQSESLFKYASIETVNIVYVLVKLLHTNWFLYSDGLVLRYHLISELLIQILCPLFQL